MGDRANIIVKQQGNEFPVVIYSHWGGSELAKGYDGPLGAAMDAAVGRVGDPNYYTALLLRSLFDAGIVSGVGTTLDDNEHLVAIVDSMTGTLTYASEGAAWKVLDEARLEATK